MVKAINNLPEGVEVKIPPGYQSMEEYLTGQLLTSDLEVSLFTEVSVSITGVDESNFEEILSSNPTLVNSITSIDLPKGGYSLSFDSAPLMFKADMRLTLHEEFALNYAENLEKLQTKLGDSPVRQEIIDRLLAGVDESRESNLNSYYE